MRITLALLSGLAMFWNGTVLGQGYAGDVSIDPEFDPTKRAYHYVRVLEIPTPSWLAYDEAFFGPQELPDDAIMVQQDKGLYVADLVHA